MLAQRLNGKYFHKVYVDMGLLHAMGLPQTFDHPISSERLDALIVLWDLNL